MSAHDVYGLLTALGLVPMFLSIMAVSRRYVVRDGRPTGAWTPSNPFYGVKS